MSNEKIAIEFKNKTLKRVSSLLSEDYHIGFKEGIEKYLNYKNKVKTEPKYEINYERLSELSIADLTGLIQLTIGETHLTDESAVVILTVAVAELNKRINDIIIF